MWMLKCFWKDFKFFLLLKKFKKTPSKVAQNNSSPHFFLTAWAAQTAPREEFMLQNMAYRPTVYRTGELTILTSEQVFVGKKGGMWLAFKAARASCFDNSFWSSYDMYLQRQTILDWVVPIIFSLISSIVLFMGNVLINTTLYY